MLPEGALSTEQEVIAPPIEIIRTGEHANSRYRIGETVSKKAGETKVPELSGPLSQPYFRASMCLFWIRLQQEGPVYAVLRNQWNIPKPGSFRATTYEYYTVEPIPVEDNEEAQSLPVLTLNIGSEMVVNNGTSGTKRVAQKPRNLPKDISTEKIDSIIDILQDDLEHGEPLLK